MGLKRKQPRVAIYGRHSTAQQTATSSADQVRMVRQIIEGLGMEVASPEEAREILALKGTDDLGF